MLETNEPKQKKCSKIIKFFAMIGMSTTFFSLLSLFAIAYIWFADPFGIRALVQGSDLGNGLQAIELLQGGDIPSLDALQEITVENGEVIIPEEYKKLMNVVGIDIEVLANQDPEVLEACASEHLGAERAAELTAGQQPGISDFLALKKCL